MDSLALALYNDLRLAAGSPTAALLIVAILAGAAWTAAKIFGLAVVAASRALDRRMPDVQRDLALMSSRIIEAEHQRDTLVRRLAEIEAAYRAEHTRHEQATQERLREIYELRRTVLELMRHRPDPPS